MVVVVVRLYERSASLIDVVHRTWIYAHGPDDVGGIDARCCAVVSDRIRSVGKTLGVWPRLVLGWFVWVVVLDLLRLDLGSLRGDWGGIKRRLI